MTLYHGTDSCDFAEFDMTSVESCDVGLLNHNYLNRQGTER